MKTPSGPRVVAGYELHEILGQGGMGSVFRAVHVESRREVALKLVRSGEGLLAARLAREGDLGMRLDHPGIVRVVDAGDAGLGVHFVAFELVLGARTLDAVLPELDRTAGLELIRDAARALGHAHARGIVHRDVKPGNVLVDGRGVAHVTDLGLGTADDMERLTRSNAVVGTPLYMSPEQAAGRRDAVGPPTDVWALGVILFETLTGRHPLFAEIPESLVGVMSVLIGDPDGPDPRTLDPSIPEPLALVVRRALRGDPEERFPDAEALAIALDDALVRLTVTTPGRMRWRGVAVAVVVLALAIGALFAAVAAARSYRAAHAHVEGTRRLAAGDLDGAVTALSEAEALAPGTASQDLARALVVSGRRALARGEPAAARAAAARAHALAPKTEGLPLLDAALAIAGGDLAAAEAALGLARGESGQAEVAARLSAAWSARGIERCDAGDLDASVAALAAAVRASHGPSEPFRELAIALAGGGLARTERGRSLVAAAVEGASDDLVWEVLISLTDAAGESKDAARLGDRAVAAAGTPGRRAFALMTASRRPEAKALAEETLAAGTPDSLARFVLARMAYFAHPPTEESRRLVAAECSAILASEPDLIMVLGMRGLVIGELGDPVGAEDLARICALRPRSTKAWQIRGYVLLRSGRLDEAAAALTHALAIEKDETEALKQRGIVRARLGDTKGAMADLERHWEVMREDASIEVLYVLGDLRLQTGDAAGAVAALSFGCEHAPGAIDLRVKCGQARFLAGDFTGAEADAAVVLDRMHGVPSGLRAIARTLRAAVQLELGSLAAAVASAEGATREDPSLVEAWVVLAFARAASKAPAGAVAAADEALRLARNPAERQRALVARARARTCAGDLDGGVADADAACAGPVDADARLARALVRSARGDRPGAASDARDVLELRRAFPADSWSLTRAAELLR